MTQPNLDEFTEQVLNKEDPDEYSYKEEDIILRPLLDELSLIKHDGIRSFTRCILLRAGPFWEMPAFFDEGFYPPDTYQTTGNIIHTKRVFRTMLLLSHSYNLDPIHRDIALSAALLHSVTKGRFDQDFNVSFDPMYPYSVQIMVAMAMAEDEIFAKESQSNTIELDYEIISKILRLVRCQMGVGAIIPETIPDPYSFDNILHVAISMAINLHVVIDGSDVIEERWISAGRRTVDENDA